MTDNGHVSMGWRTRGSVLGAVGLAVLAGASPPAAAAGGPSLGAARSFAVLGGSTVESTGLSVVTGDVGVSPGTAITGFPPGTVTGGAIHAGDVAAAAAHSDAALAYDVLAGMASIPANNRSNTDLGGLTLAPGVYKFDAAAGLTGDLTLDAGGDSGALFVFQIGTTLTSASNASVVVINGGADYDESNVFWQVGASATLGSGTAFTGNILAYSSITLVSGSTMTGNALALNGAVTMEANTITSPPAGPPILLPTAPSNLTAVPIDAACTGSNLSWTDASDNETEFRVFRRNGAGPGFVQVGSIATTNMAGTGGVVTFQNLVPDTSITYTYRVTAFSPTDGASVFSNEALVAACAASGGRLDIVLGRSAITDRSRAQRDDVSIKGSYSVVGAVASDPRPDGVTIQVRAPGNLIVVSIPAIDPRWKASKKGVYRWKTPKGGDAAVSSIVIDTRKSEFTLKSKKNEFGSVPVNSITVSLSVQGATGFDTRAWDFPNNLPSGTRAVFKLPK